jgi:hypothetical protein
VGRVAPRRRRVRVPRRGERAVLAAGADTLAGSTSHFWGMFDFRSFYAAGSLVAEGRGHDLYTLGVLRAEGHATAEPYFNPPFFALICAPFSYLSPLDAYRVWTLVSVALLTLNCVLIWRIAEPIDRPWRALMIAGFVTSFPVQHGLMLGQFSQLLCLSWAGAYLALRAGRPRLAGGALSILLIKPELVIPVTLFLAWKGERKTVETLVSIAAVLVAVSVAIIGPVTAIEYPFFILRETKFQITWLMLGWNGIVSGAFAGANHATVTAAGVVLGLLTCSAVAFAWRRWRFDARDPRFASMWLALTIATLLVDMHLYVQDTVILMPALAAYAATSAKDIRSIAALLMPVLWVVLWYPSYPDHVLSMSVVFGSVLLSALAMMLIAHAATRRSAYQPAFADAPGFGLRRLAPPAAAEEAA